LALVALLAELGYAIIVPTLPLYLAEGLKAPDRLIGWVVTAFAVVETLCQGPFGAWGDRLGRKPLIVGGLAIAALTPLLMTLIRAPIWFVPLRALDGGGSAALWPAILATVGDEVGQADRATGMQLFNVAYLIGLGLGQPLGFWITHATKRRAVALYAASGLMAAAALGATRLPDSLLRGTGPPGTAANAAAEASSDEPVIDEGHPLSLIMAVRAMIESARVQPALRIIFLLGFGQRIAVSILQWVLVLYARRQAHLSDVQFSYLFLISAAAIGALALPLARLADRMPRVRAIQIGFAVSAGSLALLPIARSVVELTVLATTLGLAFIFAEPAWLALVSTLAPKGRQGAVMGGVGAAQGIGSMVGPTIGGYLYGGSGAAATFLFCAAVLAACLLLVTAARHHLRTDDVMM
jgi:MFS family permease